MLIADDPPLLAALAALARDARLVFFAGLPGTGKSLLIHQLAHLAHARGRRIHLLQWDVARPVFEASEAGRRYPLDGGVTHGVIRLAVGRWARAAVARWHAHHRDPEHLLTRRGRAAANVAGGDVRHPGAVPRSARTPRGGKGAPGPRAAAPAGA